MDIMELEDIYQYREEKMDILNKDKFRKVLQYFYYLCKKNKIDYQVKNNLWDTFIINYKKLVRMGLGNDIRLCMKQYGANEWAFSYEYLHYRNKSSNLEEEVEIGKRTLKFYNANNYFKNTNLEEIFNKRLDGECFERTLDIIATLDNTLAIVAYLPNLFVGGYYHAFVRCNDGKLIDPACNLVIDDKLTQQLLEGEQVLMMDYEMVKNTYGEISRISRIEDYDRPLLLQIALFEEYKRNNISKKR